jgi:hypothetical protein
MKTVCSVLVILLLAATTFAGSPKPPPAPPGYEWGNCKNMKAQFLVPNGWNLFEEGQGAAPACFISKEKIAPGKEFETGLSVNLVTVKAGTSPSEAAQRFLNKQAGRGELLERSSSHQGALDVLRAEQIVKEPDWPALRLRHVIVASAPTARIYVLLFETREELWARYLPVIEPVLRSLRFEEGPVDGTALEQAAETGQDKMHTGEGWVGGQKSARRLEYTAPPGWQENVEAARKYGAYAVLFPEGKTAETTTAAITVVFQRKDPGNPVLDTLENFDANNLRNMRAASPKGLWTAPWRPSGLDPAKLKYTSVEIYPKEGSEPSPMRGVTVDAGDGFFAVTVATETREALNRPEYDAFFNSLALD